MKLNALPLAAGLAFSLLATAALAADATPAACYGHANDRAKQGDIYLQIFSPRFGDGVDVVVAAQNPFGIFLERSVG